MLILYSASGKKLQLVKAPLVKAPFTVLHRKEAF
jgi:hypothetical protein